MAAENGNRERIVGGVTVWLVFVALGMLAEGLGLFWISRPGRGPGATVGNRNFAAHLIAVGMPIALIWGARELRRWKAVIVLMILVTVVLVSRCRAAWLAVLVANCVFFASGWLGRGCRTSVKAVFISMTLALGIACPTAWLVGGRIWKSDDALRATAERLIDYEHGTGAGRLIQYRNTVRMAMDHPWLGVGPGNWSLWYPRYASVGDPSVVSGAVQRVGAFPSSDLFALVAETGVTGAAAVLALLACVGMSSFRRSTAPEIAALIAAGAALGVVGVIDCFGCSSHPDGSARAA